MLSIFVLGQTCKMKWNNIKGNFHQSPRKNETKDDKCAKICKMQKYSDQINFPKKYLDETKTKGSIECEQKIIKTTEQEDADSEKLAEKTVAGSENVLDPLSSVSTVENPTIKKIIKEIVPDSSAFQTAIDTLLNYLISQEEAEDYSSAQQEQDAVDVFLRGIAPALKILSPYQWHLAKSELFDTAQKFEAATLSEQQTPQSACSFSSSPMDTSLDQLDAPIVQTNNAKADDTNIIF